jgi:hypothetical protein
MRKIMNILTGMLFVFLCMGSFCGNSAAQSTESVSEQITQLNRTGKWLEAEGLAQKYLSSAASKSIEQKCGVINSLSYSLIKLKRIADHLLKH